ncbi:hypothetical protein [Nocardia jejuensis]|uniref:hypothetical protein n=1 Tax=Nocardia jejuensis TaxID=328049 RepID=UPI00082DE334|nr:hypothetical protein [Nocardia jejuensis]
MPIADDAAAVAQNAAYAMIARAVPLRECPQLQVVLYDELGLTPISDECRTDTDTLMSLYARTGHPFLGHVLTYRRTAGPAVAGTSSGDRPDDAELDAAAQTLGFVAEVSRTIRRL